MKKELQEKLYKNYPEIFAQRDLTIQQSAMPWGFECMDGWYQIIDILCQTIMQHINSKRDSMKFKRDWKNPPGSLQEYYNNCREISSREEIRNHFQSILDTIKDPRPIEEVIPVPEAVQVKEKYGILHFYMNGTDDFIDGAIHMAEKLSTLTCEYCSKPGKTYNDHGWIYTLCPDCVRRLDGGKSKPWMWEKEDAKDSIN